MTEKMEAQQPVGWKREQLQGPHCAVGWPTPHTGCIKGLPFCVQHAYCTWGKWNNCGHGSWEKEGGGKRSVKNTIQTLHSISIQLCHSLRKKLLLFLTWRVLTISWIGMYFSCPLVLLLLMMLSWLIKITVKMFTLTKITCSEGHLEVSSWPAPSEDGGPGRR